MSSILVIDDEEAIRTLCRRILTHEGYQVIEAPDGAEGVRQYREQRPDLIITDIIMPEKEGIETIMDLRREFPAVKIIAISGGGQATTGATCLHLAKSLGALKTLAKPFTRQELLEAVRYALEQK
jgi:CheY-like chemotaxis protein